MTDDRLILTPQEAELYDSAQRMAEAVNLQVVALRALGASPDRPLYVAIHLADGRADGQLYDTRADAMRTHPNDLNVFPVRLGRDTMPVREAMIVLQFARTARLRGVIFADEDVVVPHLTELLHRARVIQNRTLLRGDPE